MEPADSENFNLNKLNFKNFKDYSLLFLNNFIELIKPS